MKLQCQVEVVNRLHSSLNIGLSGKYIKSTLALGKTPKQEIDYFIIHFSSVNKSGTKYSVKHLKQVFTKCLNEGKTTLRFNEPPHDLCVRSEPIQLKCFMRLLKSCITGDVKNVQIAPLTTLSVTQKDNAPTKLVIRDRSDFPVKGLPRTLESLHITNLKLCNFRRDILLLKQLTILDLSFNAIEKLPAELGRMPSLCELHLSNNSLGIGGEVDWRWLLGPQITVTLKLLDISRNSLNHLPNAIWKLQKLVTLKVDCNMLNKLPSTIGRMTTLRYLTLSQNALTELPCSILQCRLEYIDLSDNKFIEEHQIKPVQNTQWEFYVGSLVDIASKVVLKQKIFYAPNVIPRTLVEYLDNANMCICGAPVVSSTYYMSKKFEIKDFYRVVVFDSNRMSTITVQCYFCSPKCFNRK